MSTTGSLSSLRRARWLGPAAVSLGILVAGWWIYGTVESATRERLAEDIRAVLDADAESMRAWLESQERAARTLADDVRLRAPVAELLSQTAAGASADDLRASPAQATLRETLGRAAEGLGYTGFAVLAADGRAVGAGTPEAVGGHPLASRSERLAPVLAGDTVVVPPFPDADGHATMVVLAPLRGAEDAAVAAICLDLDPAGDFARTLGPARAGETGETYALDADGVALSPSRFHAALAELGLVDPNAPARALALEIRNPGGDVSRGFEPPGPRRSQPLTRAAASAIEGETGVDVDGYPGYRGTQVVGAWTWIDGHGIGVVTEIEAQEAYRPLHNLKRAFFILVLAMALGGAAAALSAHRNAVLRRRVREAEKEARQLGQYTLVTKVGEGAMGEVYFARHAMLRRPCAIKLMRPEKISEQAIARFEREVQQTSRLTHPNTIQIYDYGRTPGGMFYYVMEYLVGIPLDEFIENEGPLPEGRVIFIMQQICASLNEAHGLGLVHRDIKPANIVLCRAGGAYDVVKVLDFGLVMDREREESVVLSQAGTITGTPLYMSPEALTRPSEVDARSDIYALGAVGYYLLTGLPVFDGTTAMELFNQHLKEKPLPPSERIDAPILPDFEKAILACLEKTPQKRPPNANAVARELEWCRSTNDWNRDKARHWWLEHETRLEKLYGLSKKERVTVGSREATMTIDVKGRSLAEPPPSRKHVSRARSGDTM